jgi:hypothetical protein
MLPAVVFCSQLFGQVLFGEETVSIEEICSLEYYKYWKNTYDYIFSCFLKILRKKNNNFVCIFFNPVHIHQIK